MRATVETVYTQGNTLPDHYLLKTEDGYVTDTAGRRTHFETRKEAIWHARRHGYKLYHSHKERTMKGIMRSEQGNAAVQYSMMLMLVAAVLLVGLCIAGPMVVQKGTGDSVGITTTTHNLLKDTQAELNAMAEDVAVDLVEGAEATFLEICNEGCGTMYGPSASMASTEDLGNCYTFCIENK